MRLKKSWILSCLLTPCIVNILFLIKHQVCFTGIHQLFVALVGCKPQRTTTASLVLKSTVCTCKNTELNLSFHALCCLLRYTTAVVTEYKTLVVYPKDATFKAQRAQTCNTPQSLLLLWLSTSFSKQPQASASSMATSFLQWWKTFLRFLHFDF